VQWHSAWHAGDVSYARGELSSWDVYMSSMTAIGGIVPWMLVEGVSPQMPDISQLVHGSAMHARLLVQLEPIRKLLCPLNATLLWPSCSPVCCGWIERGNTLLIAEMEWLCYRTMSVTSPSLETGLTTRTPTLTVCSK
jgi:hypothetical protein